MATLFRNLRRSVRGLRRAPGFTLAAVATLALGIGANTAVFSVLDALILRPLPYADAGRLVLVWDQLLKLGIDQYPTAFTNYYEYRRENKVLEDIAAYSFSDLNLEGDGVTERLETMPVSANLFSVLGVFPALGQAFVPDQNEPGRGNAVILSDGLWRRRFGAEPGVVGRTLRMNGQAYRIQGVMPAGFAFTIRPAYPPDVWIPMSMPHAPSQQGTRLIARLKRGVSLEQARANLASVAASIDAAYHPYTGPHGEDAGYHVTLVPLRDQLFGGLRTGVLVLAGAVVFVLLIVCANVANLLLARGAQRQRETAVRMALGATPSQILAEVGADSLVLAVAGGLAGMLLGRLGIALLPALSTLPPSVNLQMDLRVLALCLLLSLATALLFGLAPALHSVRAELALGGGRTVVGASRGRLRGALVTAEVALSVTLLAGAGLLLKSFVRLQSVDPGVDPRNVLTMRLTLVGERYRSGPSQRAFFGQLFDRVAAIPGVESSGFVNILPLATNARGGDPFSIEGRSYDSASRVPQAATRYRTSPGYFRALRIRLLSGRLPDERDGPDTPLVAVINETMARGFWPRGDAIGKHVLMGAPRPGVPWLTIIGVVSDVRNAGLRMQPIPQMYTHFAQDPTSAGFVVLRTSGDPMGVALAARRAIASVDPEQAGFDIRTLDQRLSASLGGDRFQTVLLGIFALAALALAAIGIYGVLAHMVTQRIPEIGIRMALGAERTDVLRWVFARGMTPVILGLAIGIAATFALTRLLRTLLFEISPSDPTTIALVVIVFTLVALAACAVPARKATKVDPMTALRWE